MTTFAVVWLALCLTLLLLVLALGRVGSRADEDARSTFRSVFMRQLARRRGDRRGADRRAGTRPIGSERRGRNRRRGMRRRDQTAVDPPTAGSRRRLALVTPHATKDPDDARG